MCKFRYFLMYLQLFQQRRMQNMHASESQSQDNNSDRTERIVELNFALGDFDSTPIAKIEHSNEESSENQ